MVVPPNHPFSWDFLLQIIHLGDPPFMETPIEPWKDPSFLAKSLLNRYSAPVDPSLLGQSQCAILKGWLRPRENWRKWWNDVLKSSDHGISRTCGPWFLLNYEMFEFCHHLHTHPFHLWHSFIFTFVRDKGLRQKKMQRNSKVFFN